MTPIFLFMYTVAAFGLAYIVGHAKISLGLRTAWGEAAQGHGVASWLLDLVECPACFGFWIGLVAGFFFEPGPGLLSLYTAGSNYMLGVFTGLIREE